VIPVAKEAAEFIINEAINKIPGSSLLARGAKYISKRVSNKLFKVTH
jgi:hypothetical protein